MAISQPLNLPSFNTNGAASAYLNSGYPTDSTLSADLKLNNSSEARALVEEDAMKVSNEVQKSVHAQALRFNWNSARDAAFVADCLTGCLVEVNPQAELLSGYSRKELIGMHVSILHPHEEFIVFREEFRKSAEGINRVIEGFHLRRIDRTLVPITIESMPAFEVDGRMYSLGIYRDVTEFANQQERLLLKSWALDVHEKVTHALARATSSATLLQEICDSITADSPFALAWVGMAENEPPFRVRIDGVSGLNSHYLDELEIHWADNDPFGNGPSGVALRTNTVQAIEDTLSDPRFKPWLQQALAAKLHSCIAIPFLLGENRRAVLTVYSSKWLTFSPVVIDTFKQLAESICIGLRTLEQAERLQAEHKNYELAQQDLARTFDTFGQAIVKALALHDPYTAGHQDRVADLSRAIAMEMGLDPELAAAIGMAAYLHDIGKISTPVALLSKSGMLSEDELNCMRTHAQDGYDILVSLPFYFPIAEMVYQHHERLDGSGYPRGLMGDQIHIGARIVAVADTVESMASARSYRPGMGIESALHEIESHAGTTLDARVVQTCLALFREKGYILPHVDVH